MENSGPWHRAVVLSSTDLDGDRVMLHCCEDCACEISRNTAVLDRMPPAVSADVAWARGREIVEVPLTPGYRLLFNPLAHSGAVVVNDTAANVFAEFAQPTSPGKIRAGLDAAARDEFDHVVDRLRRLQMIEPVGSPVRPAFTDSGMLTAWLHLTNDCNLRCPYCYLHKSGESMDESVGRAAIEAVVRSAVKHRFTAVKLKYAGGEATMNRPLMLSLHKYAQELTTARGLDLHATLLTNGLAMSDDLVSTLRAESIKVMISLDGVGEQHDVQRPTVGGRPSFWLVERAVAQLVEYGHAPHLSITVTNRNASGLAAATRFALERGLTFSLNFFRENECAARFADLQYSEQTMISALLDTFAVVEEFLPPWSVLGTVLDRGQLVQPRRHACGVGRDYLVVDQHGRVATLRVPRTPSMQVKRHDRIRGGCRPGDHVGGC